MSLTLVILYPAGFALGSENAKLLEIVAYSGLGPQSPISSLMCRNRC